MIDEILLLMIDEILLLNQSLLYSQVTTSTSRPVHRGEMVTKHSSSVKCLIPRQNQHAFVSGMTQLTHKIRNDELLSVGNILHITYVVVYTYQTTAEFVRVVVHKIETSLRSLWTEQNRRVARRTHGSTCFHIISTEKYFFVAFCTAVEKKVHYLNSCDYSLHMFHSVLSLLRYFQYQDISEFQNNHILH